VIAIQAAYWCIGRIYRKKHVAWQLSTVVTSPRTRKTQPPLLLRVGPCLQSCCLATHWSNPLQYNLLFPFRTSYSSMHCIWTEIRTVILEFLFLCLFYYYYYSRDSSVGIATVCLLDGLCTIPRSAGFFFLLHRVRTGSEAHPASYTVGTLDDFLGGKAEGSWIWPPTSI
jgi:hypothetical protein